MTLGSLVADFTTRRPFASAAIGLTALAGLIALDSLFFQAALDRSYLRWYVDNGALLSLALALVAVGWPDLDDLRNLVSPHPLRYLQAWVGLFGFTFASMPDADLPLERVHGAPERSAAEAAWALVGICETFLRLAWLAVVLGAVLLWLLVVAPVHYFAFLVAGAVARGTLVSSKKLVVKTFEPGTGYDFEYKDWPAGDSPPKGWKDSAFVARPFTVTAVLAAALLFGLGYRL